MNFYALIIFSFYSVSLLGTDANTSAAANVSVAVSACQHAKMKFLIVSVGNQQEIAEIADIIAHDCQWTGQCDVTVRSCDRVTTKQQIQEYGAQGFPLVLFVAAPAEACRAERPDKRRGDANKDAIDWRLYDTRRVQMVGGKQYAKRGAVLRGWAHNIADEVWPVITGNQGIFSTKIAYCKDIRKKNKSHVKHIMIADYDGNNEHALITTPTINVAPRWNADVNNPLLFYSESTNKNIRLMTANMKGQRKVASNFDGLNMQPAFSHDGTKLVYCASRGNGSCQLYYYSKGDFKKLTHNEGNNVSPSMAADGSKFYYCSDYKTSKPHIYCYDFATQASTPILEQGYCYCPSYCTPRRQVAYCKMVSGLAQLFVYDELAREHVQLTSDNTSKDECSWSPCGNFLLFAVENRGKSRLAMLNLTTNERKYLTPESEMCTYPTWSPVYAEYPTA